VFPPGKHLTAALQSVREGIDAHGGGLMRPMQARGLREAAALLGSPGLHEVADRTDALAADWTALARAARSEAALDDLQRRARDLYEAELATRESLAAVL
jgi:hypothetical protein